MIERSRRLFSLSDLCVDDQQSCPSNGSKYPDSRPVFPDASRLRTVASDFRACAVLGRSTVECLLALGGVGLRILRRRMSRTLSLGHQPDPLDSDLPSEDDPYSDDEEVMGEEAYRSPFSGGLAARRPFLYLVDDYEEDDDLFDDEPPPSVA